MFIKKFLDPKTYFFWLIFQPCADTIPTGHRYRRVTVLRDIFDMAHL